MTENEQKLLDYFNDYNFIVANDERDTYRPRTEKDWQGMSRPYRQYICSKHFEFVKWLCKDAAKIDFDNWGKLDQQLPEYLKKPTVKWIMAEDLILMVLSIQEDPIKFLATILR